MQKLLQYLSLAGKGFGIVASLTAIPGVPQKDAILIFFAASVLKDVANRFSEFIEANYITPSQAKLIVGFLVAVFVLHSVVACAPTPAPAPTPSPTPSTGTTTPSNASAAIEAALPLVRTGAAVATGAVLDFAVQQSSTRTRLADEMYAAAAAIYSMTGTGTFPTVAQFDSNIEAFGGSSADDAYVEDFEPAISALYAAYFPKLQGGDTKTATDLLNALAGGIEDATASYVSAPVATAATYDIHPIARDEAGQLVYGF